MFSTEIDISRWVMASGALIVLLFIFAYAVRYVSHKQPQTAFGMKRKRMKLIETLHLDARNKICMIEMDSTEVILAVGTNGCETIGTQEKQINEPPEEENICEPSKIEGIGFLKKFVSKTCTPEDAQESKSKENNK